MDAVETKNGDQVHNLPEARLVQRLTEALEHAGLPGCSASLCTVPGLLAMSRVLTMSPSYCLPADGLGIISPYQSQLKHIRSELGDQAEGIEVNSVDKVPGLFTSCTFTDRKPSLLG